MGELEVVGSSVELVPTNALVVIDGPTPELSANQKLFPTPATSGPPVTPDPPSLSASLFSWRGHNPN